MATIPKNIKKEHVLKAIERFDKEGLPDKNAQSQYYDLLHDDKRYPPKVIISFANMFANGIDLERSKFDGGMNSTAFKRLRKLGFKIVKKGKNSKEFINKDIVVRTCNISKAIIDNNLEKKKILKDESEERKLYQEFVQKPMQEIESQYGDSSTKLLRKYLDEFLYRNDNLFSTYQRQSHPYTTKCLTYSGRTLNSYTWACISITDKDTGKIDYKNNSQLYISLKSDGITFGFIYGDYVEDTSDSVMAIKNNKYIIEEMLENCKNHGGLKIIDRKVNKIIPFEKSVIQKVWNKASKIVVFFPTNEVPEAIEFELYRAFEFLVPIFLASNQIHVSSEYYDYLINVHGVQNKKTAKDYVKGLNRMERWLIQNSIVGGDFNIWDKTERQDLDKKLNKKYLNEWKRINDYENEHNFFSTPWKHWLKFHEWWWEKNQPFMVQYRKEFSAISKYIRNCKNSDWLNDEIYKWKFSYWVEKRVDFSKQNDEEILATLIQSQEQIYYENSKQRGVNFIKSGQRFSDSFVTLNDVRFIRNILDENWDGKKPEIEHDSTYPKLSVWLTIFSPKTFKPYANNELSGGIKYLSSLNKNYPKKGFKAFIFAIEEIKKIERSLRGNDELRQIFLKQLGKDKLSDLDWAWIAQDFVLFVTRVLADGQSNEIDESVGISEDSKYWLLAPGEGARKWDDFYETFYRVKMSWGMSVSGFYIY